MTERRFVITGAASGIGRSVTNLAADAGAAVSLVDVDEARLATFATDLRDRGVRATTIVADLSVADASRRVIDESAEFLGGIDVLVSNAGAPQAYPLTDLAVEAFDLAVALNVRATCLVWRATSWALESSMVAQPPTWPDRRRLPMAASLSRKGRSRGRSSYPSGRPPPSGRAMGAGCRAAP